MANIYFFDPLVALETAKGHQSSNTNLQTNQEQVCFYNGEVLANIPSNCVSVPINNFYNYFFTTTHSLPQQINFDKQSFNDTTKQEITQSIIETLAQVKDARVKIIVQVLQAPLQEETTPAYIMVLLDYLQFIDVSPQEIEKEILNKLLDLVRLSVDKQIELPQELLEKVTTMFEFIQNKYPQLLEKNIKLMHLQYALYALITNNTQLDIYFENLLQLLNDLPTIINDYDLVTHVFTESQLSDYLTRMQQALFSNNFINKDILVQKQIIYKFFFLTNLVYGRGDAYQEMYFILHPYFVKALEEKLDELTFYLYTPLLMSWNGTAQTREAFKQFNDEVEKPLEKFISKTLIKKYKLKPNRAVIDKKKPIKIAFLQERIINYSVHKVFYALLKALKENPAQEYEFIVYDLNFMEFGGSDIATVEELKKLGIKYIDLHKECVGNSQVFYSITDKSIKIRKKLLDDNIDILIAGNTRPEYNFLFTTRTTPIQVLWSHGNFEYDIKNIDRRITHYQHTDSPHLFNSFIVPRSKTALDQNIDLNKIKILRSNYPQDSTILASMGRLTKMESEKYLEAVTILLKKYKNTIFLACGSGNTVKIKKILTTLNTPMDRFIFTGHINPHEYGQVIDILLNTFPHEQGEAVAELKAKAKPIVSLKPSLEQVQKESKEIYPNIQSPYVTNMDDYINIASQLIEDKAYRKKIGQLNQLYMEKIFYKQDSTFLKSLDLS